MDDENRIEIKENDNENTNGDNGEELSYSQLRNKVGRRRLLPRVLLIIGICIAALLIVFLALQFFMRVDSVVVDGNFMYSDEAIIAASGIKIGGSRSGVLESRVKSSINDKFIFISSVKVNKSPSGVITITVKESSTTFFIPLDDVFVVVSENLRIIAITETNPRLDPSYGDIREVRIDTSLVPLSSGMTGGYLTFKDEANADRLIYIINNIEYSSFLREYVHTLDANFYELTMVFDSRITIRLGTASNLPDKLAFAEQILVDVLPSGRGELLLYSTEKAALVLDNPDDYPPSIK